MPGQVAPRLLVGVAAVLSAATALALLSPCSADVAAPRCLGRPATIVGTSGAETLVGTDGPDVIVGQDGNDVIAGRGGADRVCAGGGDDVARGGGGADVLFGEAGHDDLDGGRGPDVANGGDGRDRCRSVSAGEVSCEPPCPVNRKYVGTRVAERRVNSVEAQQSTPACFAESDFMLTADDQLVATHDPAMGGTCGDVGRQTLDGIRRCRLAGGTRVATLEDFLAVPLTEWYIDLKSNLLAGTDAAILHSVEVAVRAITAQRRERGAVLFLYQVTPEVLDLVRRSGIRAGMKGYPKSRAAAEDMVDAAKANGFEAICIHITYVDRRMLGYSQARGVWHLTWELNEKTPEQWRRLTDHGLTGLLTTRAKLRRAERAIFGSVTA
jgi:glycerophosphoryl diester phosphodiesterase